MLHKRHKYDLIVILAVFNLAVSLYLAITKILGLPVPCTITRGCEVVLNSKYSVLLGVPLPILGIIFYSAIIVLALLANHYHKAGRLLTLALGIGSLFSLSFLSIQLFVLKHFCEYCLATDSITILLFLWDLNIERPRQPTA